MGSLLASPAGTCSECGLPVRIGQASRRNGANIAHVECPTRRPVMPRTEGPS